MKDVIILLFSLLFFGSVYADKKIDEIKLSCFAKGKIAVCNADRDISRLLLSVPSMGCTGVIEVLEAFILGALYNSGCRYAYAHPKTGAVKNFTTHFLTKNIENKIYILRGLEITAPLFIFKLNLTSLLI